MDCPGGHGKQERRVLMARASTLVLMDCPGGQVAKFSRASLIMLQPLF